MYNQYVCHTDIASYPDPRNNFSTKEDYNLEPTRPDVGYFKTVEKRCNPPFEVYKNF
jgi:Protein of unknown function (DUF2599)